MFLHRAPSLPILIFESTGVITRTDDYEEIIIPTVEAQQFYQGNLSVVLIGQGAGGASSYGMSSTNRGAEGAGGGAGYPLAYSTNITFSYLTDPYSTGWTNMYMIRGKLKNNGGRASTPDDGNVGIPGQSGESIALHQLFIDGNYFYWRGAAGGNSMSSALVGGNGYVRGSSSRGAVYSGGNGGVSNYADFAANISAPIPYGVGAGGKGGPTAGTPPSAYSSAAGSDGNASWYYYSVTYWPKYSW